MGDRFDLEGHLIYTHFFSAAEIHDLSEDECRELHDAEHVAGFRGHKPRDIA